MCTLANVAQVNRIGKFNKIKLTMNEVQYKIWAAALDQKIFPLLIGCNHLNKFWIIIEYVIYFYVTQQSNGLVPLEVNFELATKWHTLEEKVFNQKDQCKYFTLNSRDLLPNMFVCT